MQFKREFEALEVRFPEKKKKKRKEKKYD